MTQASKLVSLALWVIAASCTDPGLEPSATATREEAIAELDVALASYEQVREALANDTLDELTPRAQRMAKSFTKAATLKTEDQPHLRRLLQLAAQRAGALSEAMDIKEARTRFGALSDVVVAVLVESPGLREGWHLFSCPMTRGFQEWVQRPDGLENPHMGQAMRSCGSEVDWAEVKPPSLEAVRNAAHEHDNGAAISHHVCPMHPSVKQRGPGQCPICGMDLVPVTQQELKSGLLIVDEGRRQATGVRTTKVTRAPMTKTLRAFGRVSLDETRLYDVTLRFSGFVEELFANETGMDVKRGAPLFTLYSPELYAAQQELLEAARAADASGGKGLLRAARSRLKLAGLKDAQVDDILARGKPYERLPVFAPTSGVLLEKRIVDGARVEAGQRVFRIGSLERVWVEADLYENDLAHVRVDTQARVALAHSLDEGRAGRVAFVSPVLDERNRTRRVRIELENDNRSLLPGMAVDVRFALDLGERLQVPASAVIYTGPRRLVFVDEGGGRLRPVMVRIGERTPEHVEVIEGLTEGDLVVSSGAFLVASESRIRDAAGLWAPAGEPVTPAQEPSAPAPEGSHGPH